MKDILIEPCCAARIMREVMTTLRQDRRVAIHGYGDVTWQEILPEMCNNGKPGAKWLIAWPTVEAPSSELLRKLLTHTVVVEGNNVPLIGHLSIFTDARSTKSPGLIEALQPFAERVTMGNAPHLTSFLLADNTLIFGNINQRPDRPWTAAVINDEEIVEALTKPTRKLLDTFRMVWK